MQSTKSSIGGKGGGGAKLTSYGKDLISAFDNINKGCWEHLDQELEKLYNL
jgi:molybdate transport system regulatory protein